MSYTFPLNNISREIIGFYFSEYDKSFPLWNQEIVCVFEERPCDETYRMSISDKIKSSSFDKKEADKIIDKLIKQKGIEIDEDFFDCTEYMFSKFIFNDKSREILDYYFAPFSKENVVWKFNSDSLEFSFKINYSDDSKNFTIVLKNIDNKKLYSTQFNINYCKKLVDQLIEHNLIDFDFDFFR